MNCQIDRFGQNILEEFVRCRTNADLRRRIRHFRKAATKPGGRLRIDLRGLYAVGEIQGREPTARGDPQ